jgi:hypothetical protein
MSRLREDKLEPVEPTFIDDVLAGRAQVEDIHDYIDRWHEAPADSPAAAMELHEFLGMSWDEYRQWGEQPEALLSTVAARRAKGEGNDRVANEYTESFSVNSTMRDFDLAEVRYKTERLRHTYALWETVVSAIRILLFLAASIVPLRLLELVARDLSGTDRNALSIYISLLLLFLASVGWAITAAKSYNRRKRIVRLRQRIDALEAILLSEKDVRESSQGWREAILKELEQLENVHTVADMFSRRRNRTNQQLSPKR